MLLLPKWFQHWVNRMTLTLRHLRGQIMRLLSTNMDPFEVIIQILVVVTGPGTIIKGTATWKGKRRTVVTLGTGVLAGETVLGKDTLHRNTPHGTQNFSDNWYSCLSLFLLNVHMKWNFYQIEISITLNEVSV